VKVEAKDKIFWFYCNLCKDLVGWRPMEDFLHFSIIDSESRG
jgi:hypothetical protein